MPMPPVAWPAAAPRSRRRVEGARVFGRRPFLVVHHREPRMRELMQLALDLFGDGAVAAPAWCAMQP
ncbi:hypothetical protein, partial [Variovorax paradoxus]|uniref:hypothetical protein n=1 Tax=Variovorax paradoxus TaxID=34073 RepID=UPI001ABC6DAD